MAEDADEAFYTVATEGRDAFSVNGSEFIGHAAPARTVEGADGYVDTIRDSHPDAAHVVPAYRVRSADGLLREYEHDDGEPTGTAGKPSLIVLRRREIEAVVVVTVRYFGGIELGVGGLARAYGRAAKRAVDASEVVECVPHDRLTVIGGYDDSGTVRQIIESEGLDFDADYGERVSFDAWVPRTGVERICDRLLSATSGRVDVDSNRGAR